MPLGTRKFFSRPQLWPLQERNGSELRNTVYTTKVTERWKWKKKKSVNCGQVIIWILVVEALLFIIP
jgi:hypothetical protein